MSTGARGLSNQCSGAARRRTASLPAMWKIPPMSAARLDAPHRPARPVPHRYAVMGAAAALAIGIAGAVRVASADTAAASTFVPVTPVRVLDTRDPVDLGLTGPFESQVGQDLHVTGVIATAGGSVEVLPAGATAVAMNVTVVSPTASGFLSIRPADAAGSPTTSSLNVAAGDIVPNAVTVRLPTAGPDAGSIEIEFDAYGTPGATDVLVDVVGYYSGEAGSGSGPAGPPGPTGPVGPQGPAGIASIVTRTSSFTFGTSAGSGDGGYALALCLPNERVVGGGSHIVNKIGYNNQPNVIVLDSRPSLANNDTVPNGGTAAGWYVEARRNNTNVSSTLVVSVQCAKP